jgi:hypothetical protein
MEDGFPPAGSAASAGDPERVYTMRFSRWTESQFVALVGVPLVLLGTLAVVLLLMQVARRR